MDHFIFHSQVTKAAKEARDRHLEMKPYFEELRGSLMKLDAALEINRNLTKALLVVASCSIILELMVMAQMLFKK